MHSSTKMNSCNILLLPANSPHTVSRTGESKPRLRIKHTGQQSIDDVDMMRGGKRREINAKPLEPPLMPNLQRLPTCCKPSLGLTVRLPSWFQRTKNREPIITLITAQFVNLKSLSYLLILYLHISVGCCD